MESLKTLDDYNIHVSTDFKDELSIYHKGIVSSPECAAELKKIEDHYKDAIVIKVADPEQFDMAVIQIAFYHVTGQCILNEDQHDFVACAKKYYENWEAELVFKFCSDNNIETKGLKSYDFTNLAVYTNDRYEAINRELDIDKIPETFTAPVEVDEE